MTSSNSKQRSGSGRYGIYENTRASINQCLKEFNDFTLAINEVCNLANTLGRSLHSLEDVIQPEIVGSEQLCQMTSRKFHNSAHLMNSLDSFSKIMMMFSDRIKSDAIDSFDNFIVQAIAPSDNEIKGIHEHNSQIIHEFRESFFSIYNHFLALAAELMENFLICHNCSTPIGFPHQPLCLTKSLSKPNVWKKTKYDDKFITFGMNFCFDELIAPGCRKNILAQITGLCLKQQGQVQGHNKEELRLMNKSWPARWARGRPKKNEIAAKPITLKKGRAVCTNHHPPLWKPSIWTPQSNDSAFLEPNQINN